MAQGTYTEAAHRSSLLSSEDWWAVWLGLFISVLGSSQILGINVLGWVPSFGVWINPLQAVKANSGEFAWLGGLLAP